MDDDDIIYAYFLSFFLIFSYFYKDIKHKKHKKWAGSVIGIITLACVLRYHILFSFLMFLLNSVFIIWLPKRCCHLVSFIYTFIHLIFTRYNNTYLGNPFLPYHTNIVEMMMTLKLVGLAFDVNNGYLLKKQQEIADIDKDYLDRNFLNPNFIDIFHYTFNFMGILTGPYYRYKTFTDFFDLRFSGKADRYQKIITNLGYVLICVCLYAMISRIWPISFLLAEEFYKEHSWLYRVWYAWPTFMIFRLHLYSGTILTETVYIMAGLGAYPDKTEPKPGHGPTKNYHDMKLMATKSFSEISHEKYNFETVHNVNIYNVEFSVTAREGMKNWNICIQYWLVATVYKRFPYKKLRTWATMLVSALWHGIYMGYYICIGFVPFYLAVEDMIYSMYINNYEGQRLRIRQGLLWFLKMMSYSYLSVAFHLLELEKCIIYYQSTYFAVFIAWGILYLIGNIILKSGRIKER